MLFAKVDKALLQVQLDKLDAIKKMQEQENAKAQPADSKPVEPQKAVTTFDDFSKMDIRIGTIIAAEKMPKSDKLLKLTVDTGIDQRTVLSGIAKHFSAEEVVGKQVTTSLRAK
jgi:methionyl-tRNA synthetase